MNGFYVGDIIGNSYTHENEKFNKKVKDFELFTERSKFSDDTILSFATIKWLLSDNHTPENMINIIKEFYKEFPDKNPTIYGQGFVDWINEGCSKFRESSGNGGAMRASVIGWYANNIEQIKSLVYNGIRPTHNTFEGMLGAEVVATCVYLLRKNYTLEEVKKYITITYNYDLNEDIDSYRKQYQYTSNAKETIRPALISLFNSKNYEDSIRNAVSFGGDTDTITTICSAISEAYYKTIPNYILDKANSFLPKKFNNLLKNFNDLINDEVQNYFS